nr:hypothetical protein [Lachnospiraceae bacterium]
MASSEEYLDKLLKDMMGKAGEELANVNSDINTEPKVSDDTEVTENALDSEVILDNQFADEIPQNVDSMGLVIDSAPSLEPAAEAPLDSEIADLMADIMPSFDAGLTSVSEDFNISTIEDGVPETTNNVFTDIVSEKTESEESEIPTDIEIPADIVIPGEPEIPVEPDMTMEPEISEPVAEDVIPGLGDIAIPGMEDLGVTEGLGDIAIPGMEDLGVTEGLGDIAIPGMENILGGDMSAEVEGSAEIDAPAESETVDETTPDIREIEGLGDIAIPGMEDLGATEGLGDIAIPGMENLGETEPATAEDAATSEAIASMGDLGIDLSELDALNAELESDEELLGEEDIEKMLENARESGNADSDTEAIPG